MIIITETPDYRPLIPFFIENELEFEEGEEYEGDEIVKCWRADEVSGADLPPDTTVAPSDANAAPPDTTAAPPDTTAASAAPQDHPRLVGGAVLATRGGAYICDGIAVDPEHRQDGLGKKLLDLLIAEARAKSASELFLVARAPGFFAKAGFVPVPREAAPEFFECFTCPQYGETCHPEVMRLPL
jgi:GNAT superfamily N-acetyltransferase